MKVLERAECLLDERSSGNMNFTVFADLRGRSLWPKLNQLPITNYLLKACLDIPRYAGL